MMNSKKTFKFGQKMEATAPLPVITGPFKDAVLECNRLEVDKQNLQLGVGFVRSVRKITMGSSCDPESTTKTVSICCKVGKDELWRQSISICDSKDSETFSTKNLETQLLATIVTMCFQVGWFIEPDLHIN